MRTFSKPFVHARMVSRGHQTGRATSMISTDWGDDVSYGPIGRLEFARGKRPRLHYFPLPELDKEKSRKKADWPESSGISPCPALVRSVSPIGAQGAAERPNRQLPDLSAGAGSPGESVRGMWSKRHWPIVAFWPQLSDRWKGTTTSACAAPPSNGSHVSTVEVWWQVLRTSSRVVIPLSAFCTPSSSRVRMPLLRASRRMFWVGS